MVTTVEAVYENGTLKLPGLLPLPDKAHVLVTIQAPCDSAADSERGAWLELSEETLSRTWDNADDDVFNELLKK
jgi:hypothetical protein